MKNSFFSLEDMEVAFASMIDDIRIYRFDDKRCPVKEIPVGITNTSPDNFFLDAANDANTTRLPVISLVRTGWQRDPTRIKNKDNYSSYVNQEITQAEPMPIIMSFAVTILSINKWDTNQIQQELIQFINPQIYQFVNDPLTQEEVSLEIIWDGLWNENFPQVTQEGSNDTVLQASTGFIVKGYLWISDIDYQRTDPIEKLNLRWLTHPEVCQWRRELRGKPCAVKALNSAFYFGEECNPQPQFQTLWGMNMDKIDEIYISAGDVFSQPLSTFQPCLDVWFDEKECDDGTVQLCNPQTSSICPKFDGIPVYQWNSNKHSVTFEVPPMSSDTCFDIVLKNVAGCCIVSESVKRKELGNPFPEEHKLYNTWLDYQHPYHLNGFKVFGIKEECK